MVVITGLGCVTGLADGPDALWTAIEGGRDGFSPIRRFETGEPALAALVPGVEPGPPGELCVTIALRAARQALSQAGLEPGSAALAGAALVLGTSAAESVSPIEPIGERVADVLGAHGPRFTVSTACAASTGALGLGRDLLAGGECSLVLVGGVEVLTPRIFAGFRALGVLSPSACAPFSEPAGTTLGEGAGFVILETAAAASQRRARPIAGLLGHGLSCDAFHETSPDPTGAGVARAIRSALADAGLEPSDIGYVNAHGTGTEANDPAEWRALQDVFGPWAEGLQVSSSKSFLGHTQGAAGVLEAIVTILALERQAVPPTLRFTRPRPHGPTDPVAASSPRPWSFTHAVSTSSAFGGANAAVVIGRKVGRTRRSPSRAVWLTGHGACGPHGTTLAELEAALAAGLSVAGAAQPIALERIVPAADPRGTDPCTRLLTAAAASALHHAGLRPRGSDRDRVGLVVAVTRTSPVVEDEIDRTVARRGVLKLPASAFARSVLCAPAGYCAKVLGLRGPTTSFSTGPGGGLHAAVIAARLLASRSDVDAIVAGGVDEAAPDAPAEGCACSVLTADALRSPGAVRVEGAAVAPPASARQALGRALERAGIGLRELDGLWTDVAELGGQDIGAILGRPAAAGSSFALVTACLELRRGEARYVAVVTAGEHSSSCALVLGAGGEK